MEYTKSYDLIDGLGITVTALAGAVLSGIAQISLFGHSASGTIATVGGANISYAFAVAVASLVGLMAYNDIGVTDLKNAKEGKYNQQQEDFAGLVAGVLGFGAVEFISQLSSFVTQSDPVALVATVVMTLPAIIIVHRL